MSVIFHSPLLFTARSLPSYSRPCPCIRKETMTESSPAFSVPETEISVSAIISRYMARTELSASLCKAVSASSYNSEEQYRLAESMSPERQFSKNILAHSPASVPEPEEHDARLKDKTETNATAKSLGKIFSVDIINQM